LHTLAPNTITGLTVIYRDDPDASWDSCADGWRHEAEASGFPAEIIGEDADGTPIVSHNGQTYMLARYHEQDTNDWFVSAKTMESYQRDRGWIK